MFSYVTDMHKVSAFSNFNHGQAQKQTQKKGRGVGDDKKHSHIIQTYTLTRYIYQKANQYSFPPNDAKGCHYA